MFKKAIILCTDRVVIGATGKTSTQSMVKTAGLPLVHRLLVAARDAGAEEVVFVYREDDGELRGYFEKTERRWGELGVKITHRPTDPLAPTQAEQVDEIARAADGESQTLLIRADHFSETSILEELSERLVGTTETGLAVHRRDEGMVPVNQPMMRVRAAHGKVDRAGEEVVDSLTEETGDYLLRQDFVDKVRALPAEKKARLTNVFADLAEEGGLRAVVVDDHFWQAVTDSYHVRLVEKHLTEKIRRATPSLIARVVNKRISLPLTLAIVPYPITPNQITVINTLLGLLSAWFVSVWTYPFILAGSILFQLCSIIDGNDGEVAKLKFQTTRIGAWVDTIGDNITYFAFIAGIISGFYARTNSYMALLVGTVAVGGMLVFVALMSFYLYRNRERGSFVVFEHDLLARADEMGQRWLLRVLKVLRYATKREFFALAFLALGIMDRLEWALFFVAIAANVAWVLVLFMIRESGGFSGRAAPKIKVKSLPSAAEGPDVPAIPGLEEDGEEEEK